MRSCPISTFTIAAILVAFPFTGSAQRLELNDTAHYFSGGVFITDMKLVSDAEFLLSGYALYNFGPGVPGEGFVASVSIDTCEWADGLFVNWSRTFADTSHFQYMDSTYVRSEGTIRGCTPLGSGAILACGSSGPDDRDAMVALLDALGDTLWTTWVRSSAEDAWFTDAQQAPDGSIYCAGAVRDTLNTTDQLVARFSSAGELLWYRTIELPGTNDAARQCFVQGDTLLVFSAIGDVAATDTINETDIGVLRLTSAGELQDSRVLDMPDGFGYGEVVPDTDGGFFLCTGVYSDHQVFNAADCGLIHLDAELDTVGTPIRVVGLDDTDGGVKTGLVFDPASGNVFIGGTGATGVGTWGTFAVAVTTAGPEALWGRLVEDGQLLFGGIGLSDDASRVRSLSAQLGIGRTYMNAWDAATGSLGAAADCEFNTATWTPALAPLEVELLDAPVVLTTPLAQARHGMIYGEQYWLTDVCPAPPPANACSVGLPNTDRVPTVQVWPNPVAPGELVRFTGVAQLYDALGRTIRMNVTQMAAPEQPGCYLVVTGERRSVLIVRE